MQNFLQEIVAGNIFACLLIFMRIGTALMIMPGVGDGFVPAPVRLAFALAISFILTPFLAQNLPPIPTHSLVMVMLLTSEALIGIFIGTIMRIMMSALDTAGSVVSIQAGFANAMLFNPVTAGQGSLMGALYASLGMTLLFVTDMHHYMLASIVESYAMFPADGGLPGTGGLSEAIVKMVSLAFSTGVKLAMPLIIVGLLMQIGFGVLGRLMPQIQIYFLALPLQIFLGLLVMLMTISAGIVYWLNHFDDTVTRYLTP